VAEERAFVGVSDHNGWAVLVTVAAGTTVLDRRRIDLIDADLPSMPHHHEGQNLPIDEALALVDRVRASADRHAATHLDALARTVAAPIRSIALRACPPLPADPAERISNYRARNVADWVMYREALAAAAAARGWTVRWYNPKTVFESAAASLRARTLDQLFAAIRTSIGPPWGRDHKLAMAAAIASASTST
jgi:hypothetical protein